MPSYGCATKFQDIVIMKKIELTAYPINNNSQEAPQPACVHELDCQYLVEVDVGLYSVCFVRGLFPLAGALSVKQREGSRK